MSGIGWFAVAWLSLFVIFYVAASGYWQRRCAEYEARYDEVSRQNDDLRNELHAARTKP